jgi:hypothetical protein
MIQFKTIIFIHILIKIILFHKKNYISDLLQKKIIVLLIQKIQQII